MATSKYVWTDTRKACTATYDVLSAKKYLDQFNWYYLPFDKAGEVLLTNLPYYPKYGGHPHDIKGRADQMARGFLEHMLDFTNRKENIYDTVEQIHWALRELFMDKTATIKDLAEKIDSFLKFGDEK